MRAKLAQDSVTEGQGDRHHAGLLLVHVQACGITGQSDPRIPRLRGCSAARASDVPYRPIWMITVSKATSTLNSRIAVPPLLGEKSEPLFRCQSGLLASGKRRRAWNLFLHGCGGKGIGHR